MAEFLAMGGYAFYVWTSYLMVAAVFAGLLLAPVIAHNALLKELKSDDTET